MMKEGGRKPGWRGASPSGRSARNLSSMASTRRRHWRTVSGVVVTVLPLCFAPAVGAQGLRSCVGDTLAVVRDSSVTTTVDTVTRGVEYRCILDRRGPWAMHLVTVDLRTWGGRIDGERALGRFLGRERVSDMAARLMRRGERPLVGLNADFFDLRTGEIENNHVVGGEWVKGAMATDSPHDAFESAHTQFAIDARGRPLIGRFALVGSATHGRQARPLVGVNYRPADAPGLVLYTPWHGERTLVDSLLAPAPSTTSVTQARADRTRRAAALEARSAHEVILARIGRRQDTVLYRAPRAAPGLGGGSMIPTHGAVLSGTGAAARAFVDDVARTGGVLKVVTRLDASPRAPRMVVGGWPRVLEGGRNLGAESDRLEGTAARFSTARHPRSAIGISRDSTRLYLLAVDGRRGWSVGMTLAEVADALLAAGAWDALNLDGGGSTALWVAGRVVNVPSDPTGERAVGNALWLFSR